ncbi:MAG TPA: M23 family metallopeptidase [Sphingomicrobium sp.]|nr:M23 family metallopeptidase [Sphingomicrobium sp.]
MSTLRFRAHLLPIASECRWPTPGWKSAGTFALLCSGVAWASLPSAASSTLDEQHQWQALALTPLASGGITGMPMAATQAVQPVDFVPHRLVQAEPTMAESPKMPVRPAGPVRVRGHVGDGLYWSLRAAGASPQAAAQYLAALATEIDVGEVSSSDAFDMVLGADGDLLYAGLERIGSSSLQLVRWTENGRTQWVDATNVAKPVEVESGMAMPAQGPITSYFGYRYHPILHFTRFHAGVDIGASWGSPIVAAGDGRVVGAGWGGGFGREVEIAHAGGLTSIYGHMSTIVAQAGSFVRAGQLIGYVGSSGLSTGPHLHFEVRQGRTPVNPLAARFARASMSDPHRAEAVKARLATLLSVGAKRS